MNCKFWKTNWFIHLILNFRIIFLKKYFFMYKFSHRERSRTTKKTWRQAKKIELLSNIFLTNKPSVSKRDSPLICWEHRSCIQHVYVRMTSVYWRRRKIKEKEKAKIITKNKSLNRSLTGENGGGKVQSKAHKSKFWTSTTSK